jgi:hypothetical protein
VGAQAVATGSAQSGLLSRQTIFFGCPAFEGYRNGGSTTLVGDTNVVQVGFGMNAYPSFSPEVNYPAYPPASQQASLSPSDGILGGFRPRGTSVPARAGLKPAPHYRRLPTRAAKVW